MADTTTVWGIDLGTTYSCISRVDESGYPVVIQNVEGDQITPSVVYFSSADDYAVGKAAKQNVLLEPENVCALVKQQMGHPDWRFTAHGKEHSAVEVSGLILSKLKHDAEQVTGETVENVVITVPAYFGVPERKATEAAGQAAGLNVLDIINEPTAAAFSYGFARGGDAEQTVLVYDLGGGTFDVTVIRLEPAEDGGSSIRVVATGGNDRLGGALWDQALVQLLARKFLEENPGADDPLDDLQASADLNAKAEDIKRSLTTRETHNEIITAGTERAKVTVTREEFETATRDLLEQTITFTQKTVDEASALGAPTIDRVLLVGGSSFMPAVARRLTEVFPGWNPELSDPNQAVAKGAALAGFQQSLLLAIQEVQREAGLAEDADGAPAAEHVEQVAQAFGIAAGVAQKLVTTSFTNVCSRAFGVKLLRDGMDPASELDEHYMVLHIIEPQTPLPVDGAEEGRVQTAYTVVDNQAAVNIELYEQNSESPHDGLLSNRHLKTETLQLSQPYPQGSPIRIELGMDNGGRLDLRATGPDGTVLQFEATASEGAVISDEEIEKAAASVQSMRLGD